METLLLCARQNMLALPPITAISVARQACEDSQRKGCQGAQREELIEGTRFRKRCRGHGGYRASGKKCSCEERDHGGSRLRHDLGGPGLESRVHEGEPPTDEHCRSAHARERRSYSARGVTQHKHAGTDQDQRARPETIGDELDGPGPAEHRKTVESDRQPGHRGTEADTLERRSEEGEEAQYHRSFYQRNPYHYQGPGLNEDTASLNQWPLALLLGEGLRFRQSDEHDGKHSTSEGRSCEGDPPALEVCSTPPKNGCQGRAHGRGCHQIGERLLPRSHTDRVADID